MKLITFVRNKGDIKWGIFLETIRLNIEKGNAVFIGNEKQLKELHNLLKEARG